MVNCNHTDSWFRSFTRTPTWRLLHFPRREDSSQVDSSRGPSLSQVLHCQWCLELWLPPLWDMVTGTQTISWYHQCRGALYNSCLQLYVYSVISLFSCSGYAEGGLRLSPPPPSRLSQENLSTDDQMLVGMMHVSMHACNGSVVSKFTLLEFCSTIIIIIP